ncbi:MAG TPA: DUF2145 domain-containing protein [Burkholderiaceae bacterium]|jgi:hypothetical protein|nr:DUF2145 domain-containing protein [Burkholderiaceae bacterium]
MSRARALWRLLVGALALATAAAATAGQTCDTTPPDAYAMTRALGLAERVQASLDASGAQVVIIARAGQDLRKYGLQWSHLAFAYRDDSAASPAPGRDIPGSPVLGQVSDQPIPVPRPLPRRGTWRIVHKLNQCGTADAAVFRQGLAEFFLDTPFRYEAAYVVPDPEVQAALLRVVTDDQRLVQWHTAPYSVVAYPWATRYQQSNQWALETLAGSLDPAAGTRERAQAWLQLHDYQPTVLHLDALTRLGARMTRANVAFDDHPNSKRFSDHIETVTVESMFAWMQRMRIAGPPTVVR